MAAKKPDPYSGMSPELRKVMMDGDKARANPAYAERQRKAFGAGTVTGGTNFGMSPVKPVQEPGLTAERRQILAEQKQRVDARNQLLAARAKKR